MGLRVVPVSLKEANAAVNELHRHHPAARGCRFCLGLYDDNDALRGVCIVGRPVARRTNHREVAEVTRVATDGVRNGCSKLLGAAARACKAMGFHRIQTFTLPEEGGASLRGAGWELVKETSGGEWGRKDRPRQTLLPVVKTKWQKVLL